MRLLTLATSLMCMTLIVPLWVAALTNWRTGLRAWFEYCRYMGALYLFGLLVWAGVNITGA